MTYLITKTTNLRNKEAVLALFIEGLLLIIIVGIIRFILGISSI